MWERVWDFFFTPRTPFCLQVVNPGTPCADHALSLLNGDWWALQELREHVPDGKLFFLIESACSVLFHSPMQDIVIKVYNNDVKSRVQADIEVGSYWDLQHLQNVPTMRSYYAKGAVRFLAMDYCGVDGLVLQMDGKVDTSMWRGAFTQLFHCLNDIHSLNRIHGDIKLENITYNGKGLWFYIDFGFSFSMALKRKNCLSGTYPFILPAFGKGREDGEAVNRKHGDYYAFALTMLALAGWEFPDVCNACEERTMRCRRCLKAVAGDDLPLAKISITSLYRATYETPPNSPAPAPAVSALASLVLSQLDPRADRVVWNKRRRTCEFVGNNPYWTPTTAPPPTIEDAWDTISQVCDKLEKDGGSSRAPAGGRGGEGPV
jgi:serine/threonine protein kinase